MVWLPNGCSLTTRHSIFTGLSPDSGCPYHLRWSFMELHLRELINIPPERTPQKSVAYTRLPCHKVDDKFLCLLYYLSTEYLLRSDRYGYHRRIGIHRPRPCNCYNVRLFALPFTAHHNRRKPDIAYSRLRQLSFAIAWLLSAL